MPPPPVNPDDLLGAIVDWLTVLAVGKHIGTQWTYQCACRCGNATTTTRAQLLKSRNQGYGLSCGCKKARAIQRYKDHALMRNAHAHQRFSRGPAAARKEN
jgi:hypothetical protein